MISAVKILSSSPATSRVFLCHRFYSATADARKAKLEESSSTNESELSKLKKWQLMVAVCLERYPLISPPPTDLEIQYQKMLRTLEDEKSLKSYHELRREEERKAAKKADKSIIVHSDERQIITAQDFEDASIEERKRFVVAPRDFGEDDNLQSLNRLLHRKLIFLVPSPFRKDKSWELPTTLLQDGETLSEAAKRVLSECLDVTPAPIFYGHAPRKFYKYRYPKPVIEKTGAIGAKFAVSTKHEDMQSPSGNEWATHQARSSFLETWKCPIHPRVFMFKAELPRQAKNAPRVPDFRWLIRDELETTIKHKKYRRSILSSIFE